MEKAGGSAGLGGGHRTYGRRRLSGVSPPLTAKERGPSVSKTGKWRTRHDPMLVHRFETIRGRLTFFLPLFVSLSTEENTKH